MTGELVRTNIEMIDKLLNGGFSRDSAVLLFGPPLIEKNLLAAQIAHSRLKEGESLLMVSTETSPELMKEKYSRYGLFFNNFEEEGRVKYVDAYSLHIGDNKESNSVIKRVSSPLALSELNIAISQFNAELWRKNPKLINVFDSISTLLMHSSAAAIGRFLQVFIGKTKQAGALLFLTMDEGMHDPKTVATIQHMIDIFIEFRQDDRNYIRVRGKNLNPMPWTPFEITEKGIQVKG